jgi:RluA family pseudouridine synthase
MAGQKPFTIIKEDDSVIVVNKASGIAVTGERWDSDAPRLDLLLKQELAARPKGDTFTRQEFPYAAEPELFTVHRIDKDTSGLVIFAKDSETHKLLSAAFENRRVEKTYMAIVHGRPSWPDGKTSCDLPLVPDGNKSHLTIIDKYCGKPSLTVFTLLLSAGNYSVVEARPETGRTHQIRVHLSALGCPIVCDSLYGKHSRGGAVNSGDAVNSGCVYSCAARNSRESGVYLSSFKPDWRGDPLEERPLLARLGLHALRLAADGAEYEAPLHRDMAALFKQMEKRRSS